MWNLKFCCHGKKSRYCANVCDIRSYPEKVFGTRFTAIFLHRRATTDSLKPLFGASLMFISLTLANFLSKFPNFRCHGNKGRSGVNFSATRKLLDSENPCLVQHSWLYI